MILMAYAVALSKKKKKEIIISKISQVFDLKYLKVGIYKMTVSHF